MTLLDESRKKIDEIDAQLVKLFEARFKAVEGVLQYKRENHMQILDSSREALIIEKNAGRLEYKELEPYFRAWYQNMMDVSKAYQKSLLEKED